MIDKDEVTRIIIIIDKVIKQCLFRNTCACIVSEAGKMRGDTMDEIGFEEYHRIRFYIMPKYRKNMGQFIQEVKDILKQYGIEHEYSTDEFSRPTLYVPHSQDALR